MKNRKQRQERYRGRKRRSREEGIFDYSPRLNMQSLGNGCLLSFHTPATISLCHPLAFADVAAVFSSCLCVPDEDLKSWLYFFERRFFVCFLYRFSRLLRYHCFARRFPDHWLARKDEGRGEKSADADVCGCRIYSLWGKTSYEFSSADLVLDLRFQ